MRTAGEMLMADCDIVLRTALAPRPSILTPFLRSYPNQFIELNHVNRGPLGAVLSQKMVGFSCDRRPRKGNSAIC